MKLTGTITLWISVIIMGTFAGCNNDIPYKSGKEKVFGGKHELRRIVTKANSSQSGTGFFLFTIGVYSSNGESKDMVYFAWKEKLSGDYIISKIEMTKIRVRIDESVRIPYVEFSKEPHLNSSSTYKYMEKPSYYIENCMNYVRIVCKEKHWRPNIEKLHLLEK